MKISLVISTYNSPDMLRLSLMSVAAQTRLPFEVVIADDGSSDATRHLIEAAAEVFPCPLKHAWQEDRGFRLAESRNNALRMCQGDYVVFIDGDIIMERHFIADHERLAERGFFVIGSRTKLSSHASARLLRKKSIGVHWYSPGVGSRLNALYLPCLTPLTKNLYASRKDKGRGCNMAMFLDDLKAVNGFDSDMVGYGLEDTDILLRLFNFGLRRKFAKFQAIEYHLYHKEKDFAVDNHALLAANQGKARCRNGIVKDEAPH